MFYVLSTPRHNRSDSSIRTIPLVERSCLGWFTSKLEARALLLSAPGIGCCADSSLQRAMSQGQTQVPMGGLLSRSPELNENVNNASSVKNKRKRRRSQGRRRREESTEGSNRSENTHSTGTISSKSSPTPKLETTLRVGIEPRSTTLHEQVKGADKGQDEGVVMQRRSVPPWSPTKKADDRSRAKHVDDTPQDSTHASTANSKEAKLVMDATPTPQPARKSKKSKKNKDKRQPSPVLEGGDEVGSSTCTPSKTSVRLPSQKAQSACFNNLAKSSATTRQVVKDSVSAHQVASPPEKSRDAGCDTPRTRPQGAIPGAEGTLAEPGSAAVRKSKRKGRKKKKKRSSSAGSTLDDDARQTQDGSTHPECTGSPSRGNAFSSEAGGSHDTKKDPTSRANGHTSTSKAPALLSESTSRRNLVESSEASTGAAPPPVKVTPLAEPSPQSDGERNHDASTSDGERQPLHSSLLAAAKVYSRQSNAKTDALANSGPSGSNGPGRGDSVALEKASGDDPASAEKTSTSPVARAKTKDVNGRAAATSRENPGARTRPGDKATPKPEAIKSKSKRNGMKRHNASSPDPAPSSSRVKSPPRRQVSTPGATQLPRNPDECGAGTARNGNHGPGEPATNGIAGANGHLGGTGPGSPSGALKRTREGRKGGVNGNPSPGGRTPRKHQEQRRRLPVFTHRDAILNAVRAHQTTVLVGETGSGKSTQIPQFLYEAGVCGIGAGGHQHNPAGSGFSKRRRFSGGGDGGGRDRPDEEERAAENPPRGGVHKAGGVVIACTQPRRVAAVTVARRVAEEAGSELGHAVGYSVRFDDCTSRSTRIKYMTDGVLLREAMSDPLLSAYGAIVLDEAHERSLETDILFGLVRRLQPRRPNLKVVVMSATLDVSLFCRFFRDAVSLHVPGRTHPVEVMYTKDAQEDYLDACLVTCLQIHEDAEGDGDVLVFLPGQEDIEALAQLLRENLAALRADKSRELAAQRADAASATANGEPGQPVESPEIAGGKDEGLLMDALVCPVFAALPQEQQLEAFEPAPKGTRKFVLATNIAETSVTINGIRYVVDSGKVKVRSFQPSTGMELLRSIDVSRAQATQRAGRAGREAPGMCFRLYREQSYLELEASPVPEISRVNLAQVVLQLKVMGVENPAEFDYVTPPNPGALREAFKTLVRLGALNKEGGVSAEGKKMAALPLGPSFAHLLVRSTEARFGCAREVLTTVACLSAENLFFYPAKEDAKQAANDAHRAFAAYEGDLPTLLNIFEGFLRERKDPTWCRRNFINQRSLMRAIDVRDQLARIMRERLHMDPEVSCGAERTQYLRCLVAGLFMNVAIRQPSAGLDKRRRCYRTLVGSREAVIHPSSALHGKNPPPECVIFTELLSTTKDFIKTVTRVESSWLTELVPEFFRKAGS